MSSDVAACADKLVREHVPDALAAWLGGSAATGTMSPTSDLDITVLLAGEPAPYREALIVNGLPIEFFVHTEESLRFYCDLDRARRHATMMRLVGTSIVLVDHKGLGHQLQRQMHDMDLLGPEPWTADDLETARYGVTDLLDDFTSGRRTEELGVAVELWKQTAELALGANRRWTGTGKWLLRELRALDSDRGTATAEALLAGLASAGRGATAPLSRTVEEVLAAVGGRCLDGFRRKGAIAPEGE